MISFLEYVGMFCLGFFVIGPAISQLMFGRSIYSRRK